MIKGNGLDIVCAERLKAKDKLAERILTRKEYEYCRTKRNPILHMAGRIAAKEALYKALANYENPVYWKDIEVLNGLNGRPMLSEECNATRFLDKNNLICSISISHDGSYAAGQAIVWEKKE